VPALADVPGLVGLLPQPLGGLDGTEPQRERLPLLRGQVLVAEEDDPVLGPGLPHGPVGLVRVLTRQVQPADLRADQPARPVHLRQLRHGTIVGPTAPPIASGQQGKRRRRRRDTTNPRCRRVHGRPARAGKPPDSGLLGTIVLGVDPLATPAPVGN